MTTVTVPAPAELASAQPWTSATLDRLTYQGFFCEFYDPTGAKFGFPTFPFACAPRHLATRRQLRKAGLRPDGHAPVAQILWWHRRKRRVAYLYDGTLAKPKRTATAAQLAAVAKALLALRTCRYCQQVKAHYIPRSLGECLDCHGGA